MAVLLQGPSNVGFVDGVRSYIGVLGAERPQQYDGYGGTISSNGRLCRIRLASFWCDGVSYGRALFLEPDLVESRTTHSRPFARYATGAAAQPQCYHAGIGQLT